MTSLCGVDEFDIQGQMALIRAFLGPSLLEYAEG